jgi:hypothetical protein
LTADAGLAKITKMFDEAGRQKVKEEVQKQYDAYVASFKG